MPNVTYKGPLSKGAIYVDGRKVSFVSGKAIEVPAKVAAALSADEWTKTAPKKDAKAKASDDKAAPATTETQEGSS